MHTQSRRVLPVVHSIKRQSSNAVKFKPAPESSWTSTSTSTARNWRSPSQQRAVSPNHSKWSPRREDVGAGPSNFSSNLDKWRPAQNRSGSVPSFDLSSPGPQPGSPRIRFDFSPAPAGRQQQQQRGRYAPNPGPQASSPATRLDRDAAPHLGGPLRFDPKRSEGQRGRSGQVRNGFGDLMQRGAIRPDVRLADDPQLQGLTRGRPERTQKQEASDARRTPDNSSSIEDALTEDSLPLEADSLDSGSSLDRTDTKGTRHDKRRRGSIASLMQEGIDVTLPGHSKVQAAPQVVKPKKTKAFKAKQVSLDVYIPSTVSVGTLSRLLNVKLETLQFKMRQAGMGTETAPNHILTSDYAILLAEEFGRTPVINDEAAFDIHPPSLHADPTTLPVRSPVVTIMGHVDHGKTTLLDSLRSSAVAKGEAGGITQHIGAFSVPVTMGGSALSSSGPKSITFLDTPGHAAFSAMRARGAGVTDIVVLVVAADDGIMPQTKEVIELIKQDEGRVGVVVAVTKVDKPEADVDAVYRGLMANGIQVEAMGGEVPSVEVSGVTGQGLPDLVETLSTLAEMRSLHAEDKGPIHGYVLESKVLKGLGPVATVLVLRGSLKSGAHLISGLSQAKVRVITDSSGKSTKLVPPGTAVTVSGWKTLPNAGDEVLEAGESDIKKALVNRERQADLEKSLVDIEVINNMRRKEREIREEEEEQLQKQKNQRQSIVNVEPEAEATKEAEGPKELRLIIKGDVSGSVEAVAGALTGIGNHIAVTKIVSSSVGDISESDVTMAKNCGAMLVGFSVNASRSIEQLAARSEVPIYTSPIIYRIMEEVKNKVISLLPVIVEKRVIGEASVLELFTITLKGKKQKQVAGCRVTNGLVEKSKSARLVRNGEVVFEGSLDTMRHLKKDVTELRKGTECGLSILDFDSVQVGDMIQMYEEVHSPGLL